jgi:hydrogenase maturation factor
MEGILASCLYSYGCPELKQIGAEKLIFNFLKNPEKSKIPFVKDILQKLEPFIYYRMIGKMNGINSPFNLKVVKAHWLGNNLLRPIKRADLEDTSISRLIKLSDLIGTKPHHNFSVIWSTKKTDKISIEKIDECLIKPGKVLEIKENSLLVQTIKLFSEGKKIYFKDSKEEVFKEILRELISFDDWVSIHFRSAREKISRNCAENLLKITKEAISFFQRG